MESAYWTTDSYDENGVKHGYSTRATTVPVAAGDDTLAYDWNGKCKSGYALECVPDALRDDKEIVLASVTNKGWALKFASEKLRGDEKVVRVVVANDNDALQYALENIRNSKFGEIKR